MSDETLNLALTGELAKAVRAAADTAGLSPAAWVVTMLAPVIDGTGTRPGSPTGPGDDLADPAAWETVTDATGVFTVSVPRGWHRELQRAAGASGEHQVVTVRSPDNTTTISTADPTLPLFVPPGAMMPQPGVVSRPPTPAEHFAPQYLQERFGHQPGYQMVGMAPAPQIVALLQRNAQRDQVGFTWVTAVEAEAEYTDEGRRVHVVAFILTAGEPRMWMAQAYRIVSTKDARPHVPVALRLAQTLDLTPAARACVQSQRSMQQMQHRMTMDSIAANTHAMTQGHQQRMQDIQASGQAHQMRMQQLQAGWDGQLASWEEQQRATDASHAAHLGAIRHESTGNHAGGSQHQDFLNMIKEQRTVVDAQGHAHQVDAGFDKYYYREYDQSWIGLEQHQDIHDVPGINPDDYYETRIQS